MSGPRAGLGRRIGRLLLALWLDAEDTEAVLDDMDVLAADVRARRGSLAGRIWYAQRLAQYPLFLCFESLRGGGADAWGRDLRLGLRRILRRKTSSAVIVGTLAIGIGAGTAVYSVLAVLVLNPLPFGDPDELVRVREEIAVSAEAAPREVSVSPRRYESLRDRADFLDDVAAARYRTFTLAGDGSEPERVVGLLATWNHFTVLDVPPLLGRTYGPDEDRAGAPAPVAVVSHSLWTRRFGRDPAAVGSELVIDGTPHTVLGVMPPGFRYPYAGELWVPMGIDPAGPDYEDRGLNISARVSSATTLESLPERLAELSRVLGEERPDPDALSTFAFRTLEEEILEGVPAKVIALLWAAAFVLAIGAVNIASMILARLHSEEREIHVQVALGAGRGDLIRRFLSETAILAALGLAGGLLLSANSVGLLAALSPVSDLGPYFQDVGLDARVVGFGALLAVIAVGLASLPTVVGLRRGSFGTSLRSRGVGARSGGVSFLDGLVAVELAVAVVLLTGAGLTVETIRNEWGADLGIEVAGLHTFGIAPTSAGYAAPIERVAYVTEVLERIRSVPGVRASAATNFNPMRSHGWGARVWPEGRAPSSEVDYFTINHRAVTPGYFETSGTRLLAGRDFEASDGPDSPDVAIINQRLAERLWPDESALGKQLRAGAAGSDRPLVTVVGVAEDVKEYRFLEDTWYRPYAQDPTDYNTRVVEAFVRSDSDPSLLVPAVRAAIRDVDPGVAIFDVEAMSDILAFERRVEAFATLLLTLFAGIGVLLAAVGVYGVLSYATGQRRREFGLRVALGASRVEVIRDVTRRTGRSCLMGLVLGLGGALLLGRLVGAVVPGVPVFSLSVFFGASAIAVLVGCLAAAGPALKALSIEPSEALAGDA